MGRHCFHMSHIIDARLIPVFDLKCKNKQIDKKKMKSIFEWKINLKEKR